MGDTDDISCGSPGTTGLPFPEQPKDSDIKVKVEIRIARYLIDVASQV
jgi:hypothetical protein